KLQVRLLLPRKHAPGGLAHVGAIEIQPDASSEHLDVVLAEARVCARDAGLRAVKACVDTPRKRVFLNERPPRGGPQHFRHGLVHGQPPSFTSGVVSCASFVSTTNTARSLAGAVSLALALTRWMSPGSSEKLCPAVYVVTGSLLT